MELYPNNPSMDSELIRLFQKKLSLNFDDCPFDPLEVEEEFKRNGRDSQYVPEFCDVTDRDAKTGNDAGCTLQPTRESYSPFSDARCVLQQMRGSYSPLSYECNGARRHLDELRNAIGLKAMTRWLPSPPLSSKCSSCRSATLPMKRGGECVFCRNNGEMASCYRSHTLKDRFGNVTCPILRAYTCPICKASGNTAHTVRYCPKNKTREEYIPRMVNLRSFVRSSTGRKVRLY